MPRVRPRELARELKITAQGDEAYLRALLAQTARQARDQAIGAGEASETFDTYVNGRQGAAEDQVQLPGPITYRFSYLKDVAVFALGWARANSPRDSGDYRNAWFVMVDGTKVDPDAVPPGAAEIIITNDQPYARKIEVGSGKFSVPPGIVERLQRAIRSEFGTAVGSNLVFIELEGGYVLKGRRPKRAAKRNRKSSAHRAGRATLAARKDTKAGQPMRYPALVITSAE